MTTNRSNRPSASTSEPANEATPVKVPVLARTTPAPATVAAVHRLLRPGGRLVIVPEARLGGPRPLRALVDWLYAFTGQRAAAGDDPAARLAFWSAALSGPGFDVRLYEERVSESFVTVVVAERPWCIPLS